jgi:hypothetical protein
MKCASVAALACLAAACTAPQAKRECAAAANRPQSAEEVENRVLGEAYSQLYDAASGLRWLDDALLFKRESKETQTVIGDLAHYAAELKGQLEQLAQDYPAISIHDDGLPLLEKRKREAQQRDRLRSLAPVTGATGADFERTLLLTQSGALNQLRFLAQALAEAEKNPQRQEFAAGVQRRLDGLYREVVTLLDRRFFRQPAHSPLGESGKAAPSRDEPPR